MVALTKSICLWLVMGLGGAKSRVGNEPFAVLLGDDLIHGNDEVLQAMVKLQEETGGSVVALVEVAPEVGAYGYADIIPSADEYCVSINGLVEKPSIDDGPFHPRGHWPLRAPPRACSMYWMTPLRDAAERSG